MSTFELGQIYEVREDTKYHECRIPEEALLLVVALYSSYVEFEIINPDKMVNSTLALGETISWTIRTALTKPLTLTSFTEDEARVPSQRSQTVFKGVVGLRDTGRNLISAIK